MDNKWFKNTAIFPSFLCMSEMAKKYGITEEDLENAPDVEIE